MEHKKYSDRLNSVGLKSTKHINEVFEVMEKHSAPLTVEDIYIELKEDNSTISLSTIYRILEKLVLNKLVTKTNLINENKAVYELDYMQHKHSLICIGCNKKVAIDHCPIDEFEKNMEKDTGFEVEGHRLELYGYCPECRRKNNK